MPEPDPGPVGGRRRCGRLRRQVRAARGRIDRRERRRIDDRAGRRARRDGRRGRRGRLCDAPGERLLQQRSQFLRALVREVVDVELQAAAVAAGLVEAIDPLLHLLQIRRLRRYHEQRIHPLDGDNAQDAGNGAQVLVTDDLVQFGHHRLDVRVDEREHARRHPRHPVDVEHVDRFHQVAQFALGAGQDQQIAQFVRAHGRRVLGERLQQPHHFLHADIAQRHDLHREASRQCARRIAKLRHGIAAHSNRLRHDLIQTAVLHHRRAIRAKQRFQRRRQHVARDARRRADRHGATDRRVDRVVLVEDVAQDIANHFAEVRALEIEDDGAAGRQDVRSGRERAARELAPDHDAGALEDTR